MAHKKVVPALIAWSLAVLGALAGCEPQAIDDLLPYATHGDPPPDAYADPN